MYCRWITVDRINKFLSNDEWTVSNLSDKRLYHEKCPPVSMEVFSPNSKTDSRPLFQSVVDRPQSVWKTTKVGEEFGPSWATHWFKLVLQPQDSWDSDAELHFIWNSKFCFISFHFISLKNSISFTMSHSVSPSATSLHSVLGMEWASHKSDQYILRFFIFLILSNSNGFEYIYIVILCTFFNFYHFVPLSVVKRHCGVQRGNVSRDLLVERIKFEKYMSLRVIQHSRWRCMWKWRVIIALEFKAEMDFWRRLQRIRSLKWKSVLSVGFIVLHGMWCGIWEWFRIYKINWTKTAVLDIRFFGMSLVQEKMKKVTTLHVWVVLISKFLKMLGF